MPHSKNRKRRQLAVPATENNPSKNKPPAMPRQGPRRLPAAERDLRLAEEVLYLHTLWRRGGPAPAPAPVPAPAPIQSCSDQREQRERSRLIRAVRREGRERLRLHRELRLKERMRRNIDRAAAATAKTTLAPSPPASSSGTLAEAAGASAPPTANPPPPTTPPGSLAQREAVRSSVEFTNRDPADVAGEGSDWDGDKAEEEEAARYFTGLFERDAWLRGYYTGRWRKGRFQCMVCAAGGSDKVGKAVRRFWGCLALVHHAREASLGRSLCGRHGRRGAHRALAAVVCRMLGWDIEKLALPRNVIGPPATAGVQHAKENDGAGENNGFSTHDDSYSIDEDGEEDIEIGMPDPATDGDEKAEEEEAAHYFTGLFERDAWLRGHYTGRWRKGRFQCMVCAAGRSDKVGKAVRRFRGCLALVDHARDASRGLYGRRGAHRALAAVVCRMLGWDIKKLVLPRVVIDPRATAGVQHTKENDGAGENNGFSTDDDSYSIDEDEESDDEESVDEEEDIEIGMPDPATDGDEEDSEIESNEEYAEKEDHENRMEDSSTDGDEDADELERSKEAGQKEAANSIARKWDMNIRDHLLSLTHAKPVGTPPKKTEGHKSSSVPKHEVSIPDIKFNEGSDKAKRKASALSYQGLKSSTSGVVKKVKVNQQPSNKGKQIKTNEIGASARKDKRPAAAARKAKQRANKQLAKKRSQETTSHEKQGGCLNS